MLGSEPDLKMHVQNVGYPLPLKIGGPKTTYSTRPPIFDIFDGFAT